MKGYFLDRRSRGHEARADLEALAEQERLVRKYALDRDYGTKHWQPDNDAKLLADAHGRGNEYGAMRVAGMFVHGLSTVTSERYWLTDEGVYVVGGASPNPKRYERDAALFASHSMLHSARAVLPHIRVGRTAGRRRLARRARARGAATPRFFIVVSHGASHDLLDCRDLFLSGAATPSLCRNFARPWRERFHRSASLRIARTSATEPCPASDAEPPLHCPVLLPILRRTPNEQHANENERYEQHQEHDHHEGDIHTVVLPEAPASTLAVSCKRLKRC
jgi:hypothetical protein